MPLQVLLIVVLLRAEFFDLCNTMSNERSVSFHCISCSIATGHLIIACQCRLGTSMHVLAIRCMSSGATLTVQQTNLDGPCH